MTIYQSHDTYNFVLVDMTVLLTNQD